MGACQTMHGIRIIAALFVCRFLCGLFVKRFFFLIFLFHFFHCPLLFFFSILFSVNKIYSIWRMLEEVILESECGTKWQVVLQALGSTCVNTVLCFQISQSIPSLLVTAESNGGCRKEVTNEYDSGNEMCSPPSTQSSSSVLKLSQEKESPPHQGFGHVPSSVKTPNGHSDNISDSGNSSASSFSFTKELSVPLGDSLMKAKRWWHTCKPINQNNNVCGSLFDLGKV